MNEPDKNNEYLKEHAELLLQSYYRLTQKPLLTPTGVNENIGQMLYEAPCGLVSHTTDDDPIFNYANQTALRLFEMDWVSFTSLPSRQSAEHVVQEERKRLLARVSENGFIDDYRGVRISASGKRFMIEDATVWNMIDENDVYRGQAAVFYKWFML